jgi:hypothetical protein
MEYKSHKQIKCIYYALGNICIHLDYIEKVTTVIGSIITCAPPKALPISFYPFPSTCSSVDYNALYTVIQHRQTSCAKETELVMSPRRVHLTALVGYEAHIS